MFCPKCGSTQSDELKFCKACGANLGVVRDALHSGQTSTGSIDWSKTWVAEMFQTTEDSIRRQKQLELLQGITPETKRRNEIKAGVITASVGVGLMVFLYFLMQGIILSGNIKPGDAEILSRVWLAGIIPVMVGIALIINGTIVSRKIASTEDDRATEQDKRFADKSSGAYLPPADTNELFPAGFSVTDETTQHLKESIPRRSKSS
jgi:hypothetical protein